MNALAVINMHYVREEPADGIHPVTPAALTSMLQRLGVRCTFVDLPSVILAATGATALPDRAVLLTFDDGLREQIDVALPILERLGIPGAFFVHTRPYTDHRLATTHMMHWLRATIGTEAFAAAVHQTLDERGIVPDIQDDAPARQYRYDEPSVAHLKYLLNVALPPPAREEIIGAIYEAHQSDIMAHARDLHADPADLHALADRGMLGAHGHDHLALAQLDDEAIMRDLSTCRDVLTTMTRVTPIALSYPFGGPDAVDQRVLRAAGTLGFAVGFTMRRAVIEDITSDARTPVASLALPRFDINDVARVEHWLDASYHEEVTT